MPKSALAGVRSPCGVLGCSNRYAALDEEGCPCCPLLIDSGPESELLPLQESSNRTLKPEYAGYAKVQLAIDSGAAASVMPEKLVSAHPVREGDASRNGTNYLAADGGRIPNLGEVELGFITREQHRCKIKFQVAAVKRPLLAVSTLTKAGNEVHFDSDGGRIVNKATKREIHFRKSNGIFVLDVLMAPPKGASSSTQSGTSDVSGEWKQVQRKGTAMRSGFTRPGAQT